MDANEVHDSAILWLKKKKNPQKVTVNPWKLLELYEFK